MPSSMRYSGADSFGADGEPDVFGVGDAGQLRGEVAGVGA
jgi:hypothetical protein